MAGSRPVLRQWESGAPRLLVGLALLACGFTLSNASRAATDTAPTEIVLGLNLAHAAQEGTRRPVTVGATLSPAVALTEATVVTVTVGDSGDSATGGTDYTAVGDFTLTIAAGETHASGEFVFVAKDDAVAELDERVTVSGTADGFTVASVSLTITDDEPPIGIRLSLAGLDEALEEGTRRTVTVTAALSSVPGVIAELLPAQVTLASDTVLTVAVGDSGDSATEGTDYTAVDAFTVTIPAGSHSGTATFVLDLADDDIADPDERVTVSATTDNFTFLYTSGPYSAVAVATGFGTADDFTFQPMRLTIIDTDTAPTEIVLGLNLAHAAQEGTRWPVRVGATLSPAVALTEATVVTVTVGNSGDSATGGTDYAAVGDFTLTIAAGETYARREFLFVAKDDAVAERNERVTVSGTADGFTVASVSLTITDDEPPIGIRMSLAGLDEALEEGTRRTVTVTAALSSVPDVFAEHVPAYVTLASDIVLTVAVGDSGDSATEGTDYTAVDAFTVTIPAGSRSGTATFVLDLADDDIADPDERVTVSATTDNFTFIYTYGPHSAVAVATDSGRADDFTFQPMSLTIIDTDTAGVTISESVLSVEEGASETYTVVLDTRPTGNVEVSIDPGSSTTAPITVTPTSLSFGPSNWSTAQTVTVTADEDDDAEGGTRTLSHRVTGYGNVIADPVTVAVTDDDTPGVTLTPSQTTTLRLFSKRVRVHEDGAPKTYTVVLDTQPTGNVELTVRPFRLPQHGGHSPIAITPTTLRFDPANWSTPQTVTVTAEEDDDVSDGLWFLEYRVSGYGTVTTAGWVPVLVLDSGDAGVTISKSSLTVEEGASGSYTVVLDTQPPGAVKVIIDPGTDTAPPILVTPASLTLSFDPTNWDTAQTVTVAAGEDADAEGGTRTLSHRVTGYPNAAYDPVRADPVEVRVIDNETAAGVTISESALSVEEGASETYTVVLDTRPTGNVEVSIDPGSSTTAPVTVTPTSLSFDSTNWSAAQTVTVTADEDGDTEDGTRTLSHTVTGYGTVTTADPVSVSVNDNDTAGVTISASSLTIEEGASETYTVVLDTRPTGNVEVSIDPGSSTTAPVTVTPTSLRFDSTNWSTAQTVTVTADPDDDAEDGTRTLSHTVTGYGTVTTADPVTVTVADDDTAPTEIALSLSPVGAVEEGASPTVTVTATLSPPDATLASDTVVTVAVGDSGDSATEGTDFTDVPDFMVTIPAGATSGSGTFDLEITEDTLVEGDEALTVSGSADLPIVPATLTITDDDTPRVVLLNDAVGEGDGGVLVRVVLAGGSVSGAFTITVVTADGSAAAGSDYTATTAELVFSGRWLESNLVTVPILSDNIIEEDETFTVRISGMSGVAMEEVDITDTATMRIIDDDIVWVIVTEGALTVGEGTSGTYTVVLGSDPGGTALISIAEDSSTTAPITVSPTSLSFDSTNWSTAQIVTVTADEDDDAEGGTRTLSHRVTGYGNVIADPVTVAVTDDDTPGVTLTPSQTTTQLLLPTHVRVHEDGAPKTYTVVLDTQPTGNVELTVRPFRLPQHGGHSPFAITPTTLRFDPANWNTPQTVTVTAEEDDDVSDGLWFLEYRVSGYGTVTTAGWVPVLVIDSGDAGVTISKSSLTVEEGASESYTVVLDTQPPGAVKVIIDPGADTAPPILVTPASLTLSFDPTNWDTAQTVTVAAGEDADAEGGTRTLSHRVTGYPNAAYDAVRADPVEVRVIDSEPAAGVTISESALSVEEGASETYTVVLDTRPTGNVEVTIDPGGSLTGPVTVTPTSLSFDSTNWSATQTVTVTADEDDDAEDGTRTLSHTITGYGTVTTADPVTVSVTDDDTPGVTLTPSVTTTELSLNNHLVVEEGEASQTYTVVLDTQPTGNVELTVEAFIPSWNRGGNAPITITPTTLRFDPTSWDTPQTVTVAADEDDDAEFGVWFLEYGVSGYGTVTTAGWVAVLVVDDDPAGVTISTSSLTVEEGASGSYTVVLDTQPPGAVEVIIHPGADTAPPVRITPASLTLSFDPTNWDTAQTVTVAAPEDADAEGGTRTLSHTVTGYTTAVLEVVRADPVEVRVIDNDPAGVVTISERVLTVEEGASEIYTVVLDTPPAGTAEVTIDSGGSLTGPVTVTPTSLSFDSTNWNTAQTVTVTADPDDDAEDGTRTLSHTVTGYGTVTTADPVTVTVADDDTAGVTISESVLTVEEEASETYTVVLDTQPAGTAEITIDSGGSLTGPVTVTPTSLRFDSTNWSTAQTVTVTADPDDDAEDGTRTLSHTVTGYGTVTTADPVTVTVADDDTAGVTISESVLTVEEEASETYTVVLDTQPAGTAEITIDSGGSLTGPITVTPISLSFDSTNWSAAQTVTVTADPDDDAEDGTRTLSHTVTGYGTVTTADPVTVTVADDDTAGVSITPTTLSIEEGAAETYTVVLDTQPTGNVEVTIDPGGSLTGPITVTPTSLRFDSANWSTAQTVTVTADEDDDTEDGTRTLSHTVTGYGTVTTAEPVTVTVADDDTAGVTISESVLTVGEGASETYTVVLDTQPTRNVEVTIDPGGSLTGPITVTPTSLSFDPTNWSTTQTVTVTADEDDDAEDGTRTLSHTVTGYGAVTTADPVTVTVDDDDTARVTISKSVLRVGEGASELYTVVLDTQPAGIAEVTIDSGGSLTGPITVTPTSLSFDSTNWSTAQTVTVTADEDDDAEDGTRTLSHTVTGYGNVIADPVTVTVTDNDTAGVTISKSVLTVGEGASETYTVVLDTQPAGIAEITIDPGGSLTGPITVTPTSLRFDLTNWSTAQTVTVTADEDDDAEDGTRTLSHTVTGYGTVTTADPVTVAVADDDTAGVTISESVLTVGEGASETYTVVLDTQPAGIAEITIDPGSSPTGPATVSPTSLSFDSTNWSAAQTVTVTADDDDDAEDGTRTLSHTVTGYGTVTTADPVTVTVTDDDTAGVTISKSVLTVGEGASETYTVVLDTQPTGNVEVTIDPGGSLTGPVTVTPTSLRFDSTNWSAAQTVTVTADEDDDGEDGTRTLSHAVTGYGTVTTADPVTVVVADDDNTDVALTLGNPGAVTEGGAVAVTATLNAAVEGGLTVTVETADGTATSGEDYTALTGHTLTFAGTANERRTFTVQTAADTVAEGEESFTVGLSGLRGTAVPVDTRGTATVVITDDDTPPTGVVLSLSTSRVNEPSASTGTTTTTHTVTARLTGGGTRTEETFVSVTVEGTATGGRTGTNAQDANSLRQTDYVLIFDGYPFYTCINPRFSCSTTGTVSIPARTASGTLTFELVVMGDARAEGDETLTFSGNTYSTGLPVAGTTLTITDADNTAAAITLVDPDPVVEGRPVRMTARLNAEVQGGLTVRVETADGSATAGKDYTGLVGHTLTFAGAAGEEQAFMVQTMEDAVAERDVDFVVGLSGLAGTSVAVSITDRATVTIMDDDDAFAAVTLGNVRVGEENGEVVITAMLDVAIPGGFTVEVSTADGTARAGSDYTAVSGHTLTFAGNRSERQTFAVPILSDRLVEGEEYFTVSLSLPDDSPLTGASSSSGTVVITDDDTPAVTLGSGTVEEGSGTVTLTATLNVAVPGGFTVEASTADRTATAPGDYTALAGHTLTFAGTANEKQMFTVTVADDSDAERDETFRVMLGNLLGTAATVMTDDTGIVTITDDDIVPITLRLDPAQIVDTTGTATVSVTASAPAGTPPATAVTIAVTVAGKTAVAGEDFTPVPAFTIPLAAGATRGTGAFVLTVLGADGQEGAETLVVSGKADGFAVRAVPLTLVDENSLALESVGSGLVREAIADVSNVVADRVSHQIAGPDGPRFDWSTSLAHGLAANQQALNDGNWSWRELLERSSFEFRIGEDPDGLSASDSQPSGPSGIGLWAAAEGRRLSSGGGDFGDYDGRLFFVHAGADMPIGRGLAGLAVSSSRGSFDFDDNDLDADTELVNYTLYLGAPLEDAANLWATLGYGTGEIVSGPAGARNPRDIKMTAASLGGRANVLAEDGLAVDFEGEVSTGRLKFANGAGVVNPAADVHSLRLALDLEKDTESDTGIVLTRSVAFGVRLDGGDGETGAGIGLEGGLSRTDPASGLTAELTGDVLFSRKGDSRTREGGLGGAIRYRQNASGRGLLLRTSSSYSTGSEDLTRRWLEDGTAGGDSPDAAAFEAEAGYGLPMLRGNGMLTPYLGFEFTRENARHYLLGSRVRIAPTLELELESAWLEKVSEKDSEARLDLRIQGKW